MPMADPLRRRLYNRATRRAHQDLVECHRDEFKERVAARFKELLHEHGLEED